MCAKYKESGGMNLQGNLQHNNNCVTDGTVHDVYKQRSGRPCTATCPTSSAMVLEQFIWSPQKSAKQYAHVVGISRSSVQHILKCVNGNFMSQGCYMP
jgi:hypothetical protein